MMKAPEFADAVGRKNLADALDVGASAVSNAVVRGWFPSSWFLISQTLAQSVGAECPPELFGMRLNSQYVNKTAAAQSVLSDSAAEAVDARQ